MSIKAWKKDAALLLATIAGAAAVAGSAADPLAIPVAVSVAFAVKLIEILASKRGREKQILQDVTKLKAEQLSEGPCTLPEGLRRAAEIVPEYEADLNELASEATNPELAKKNPLLLDAITGLFETTGPTTDPEEFAKQIINKPLTISTGDGSPVLQLDFSGSSGNVNLNISQQAPTTPTQKQT